jgi:hypothetical protein
LELKEYTLKEKTKVADYSFIFHKMKNKPINAINASLTQPLFIDFLNKEFDANIDAVNLPKRNPSNKSIIYNRILDKYRNRI